MDHSSPPLDTLRAFEAAARSGSFSAAAEALNLTHGAVSRQVAKLEHWLGLRVFERQARGVALTPEGQRLFQRTQEAFSVFADSSDRWSEPRGAAVVRFSATPSVCSLWLMPRWQRLESGEPSLRIVLQVDHRKVDLEEEGIDLAIRCGRGGAPGRVSVQLFEEWCYPVASPELAKAIGEGRPERFLDQPLIHDSDAAGWRAWFNAQGLDFRPRQQDRRFEDYNLVLDAAACWRVRLWRRRRSMPGGSPGSTPARRSTRSPIGSTGRWASRGRRRWRWQRGSRPRPVCRRASWRGS
jgi:LysR family transcriptional regulator, glycine cleavage system transcriptional activator